MKSDISIDDFISLYEREKDMYFAWGNFVYEHIQKELIDRKYITDEMIKIPVIPRIKEIGSLVEKAFVRKHYEDPYNDITDKVGVRFVVLIESHINIIKDIIKSSSNWVFSEDVDYKKDQEEKPELFTYQSVHYIVKSINDFEHNGQTIKKNTPCEIQVRTLEQHAYAEISHDTVYKKSGKIDVDIKRFLARSMALNEATDDLFERVYALIEKEKERYNHFTSLFKSYYDFKESSDKLNKSIFDSLEPIIDKHNITIDSVKQFIDQKMFIRERIKEKESRYLIYKEPVIFLLYYLAKTHSSELPENWELTDDLLMPIYSDLGISYGDN